VGSARHVEGLPRTIPFLSSVRRSAQKPNERSDGNDKKSDPHRCSRTATSIGLDGERWHVLRESVHARRGLVRTRVDEIAYTGFASLQGFVGVLFSGFDELDRPAPKRIY
jgi:hypothetical protein